jgi:hypothetical protein
LSINRPVYLVGRVTMPTSVDFGMQVNQLVLLGSHSRMTLAQLVLENLAPGDERSLDFAGADFDVQMGYNMWPMLYPRCGSDDGDGAAAVIEQHLRKSSSAGSATAWPGLQFCSAERRFCERQRMHTPSKTLHVLCDAVFNASLLSHNNACTLFSL